MKKTLNSSICIICLLIMAAAFFGCTEKIPGEAPYTIEAGTAVLQAELGETVVLPPLTATAPDGKEISDGMMLEILYTDGSVYMPKHRLSLCSEFAAYKEGKYYAVYTLEINGSTLAKETVEIEVRTADHGDLTVDGTAKETLYSAPYITGVQDGLSFRFCPVENGIFIFVQVADTQLIYNDYLVSRITGSDGFEISLNFSGETGYGLNSSCRKIRVCADGRAYVYSPSASGSLYEVNEAMTAGLSYAVNVDGTVCVMSGNGIAALDTDTGYTFEAYLSYKALGVGAPQESVGIAFTHRDITVADEAFTAIGAVGNKYFSTVDLPEGIIPILSQNGKDYEYATYEDLAMTEYYSTMYISGENKGNIVAAAEIGG